MSTNELLPLFPSALHPALPVATQILSTLRNLTAPGKGNDLRSEERAALVGVAALIGCEKVQSKDLLERSAQKACSVSPAHFRSALAHARRLLKTVTLPFEASPRRSRSTASSRSPSKPRASTSTLPETNPPGSTASPFSTPKKRFKYSSGVDISGLVRSTHKSSAAGGLHSPAASSPLRHSVTPSKLHHRPLDEDEDAGEEVEEEEEEVRTPTKRIKFGTQPGVDLEHAHVAVPAVISSVKRKREDVSSFFSLRPGGDQTSAEDEGRIGSGGDTAMPIEDGLPDIRPRIRRNRISRKIKKERRDWRYPELVWGSEDVKRDSKQVAETVLDDLPLWLSEHNRPIERTGSTLEEILLNDAEGDPVDMDVEMEE